MKTEVRIFRALPEDAARIRRAVFMEEQGFHDEFDKADETASHLVLYIEGTPAATCRFFPGTSAGEYIVGRIAVRKESRGQHLGSRVLLAAEEAIKACADRLKNYRQMIYMARGINLATAMEGALKRKEISYINANAYAAGELKHGPIALLDADMPVLALLTPGAAVYDKMLANCEEARARRAFLAAVTFDNDNKAEGLFDVLLKVPSVAEILSPLLLSLPLQLFAYHIADKLGREVDQPRNLAKSVTVE